MKTMTSSDETLPSPQPRRRTNRFVYWAGRILLGLLALIVLLAACGATYEAIMAPASAGANLAPGPGARSSLPTSCIRC